MGRLFEFISTFFHEILVDAILLVLAWLCECMLISEPFGVNLNFSFDVFGTCNETLFADFLPGGGTVSLFWPKFLIRTMQASDLLVPSPFGRSFLRLPPWFQEALRDHGFGPHQSDGHVLMLSCLRTAIESDVLVIDDQPTLEVVGDRLTWTDAFAHILNSALTRMGGDPNAGDPMKVHELMVNLLSMVPRGPDPTAYSDRQLRWEIVDREKWVKSFTPSPITNLQLVKWRHWKPSRIKEVGPYQPEGPGEPPPSEVGRKASLPPDTTCGCYSPLGTPAKKRTRPRSSSTFWETDMPGVGTDGEVGLTYSLELQLCWDTLRWFSKKFGMMAVHEEHRLLQKKQTVEESLTPAVTQPSWKAKVPPKEVIWALEEGAAGVPIHPGADSPQGLATGTGFLYPWPGPFSGGMLCTIQ